jgi:serine/threonine protein kinase
MGAVYEVEGPDGMHLAAKVIAREVTGADRQALKGFVREARSASTLDSPNVVRVIEAGADSALGMPFIIMELLHGSDLGSLLEGRRPLEPDAAVRVFVQAAYGVAAAHARGIVHRDLKPANLFLEVDPTTGVVTPKVCDFGIAKQLHGEGEHQSQELTRTGGVMGSPMYMSPEQARNAKNVDFRADIWSFCATLWEALAGRRLWHGHTALGEIILAICSHPIPELRDLAPWACTAAEIYTAASEAARRMVK